MDVKMLYQDLKFSKVETHCVGSAHKINTKMCLTKFTFRISSSPKENLVIKYIWQAAKCYRIVIAENVSGLISAEKKTGKAADFEMRINKDFLFKKNN